MANDALVRKLLDETEIRNIIARLAHLADDGDLGDYIALFTEDGVWEMKGSGPLAPFPAKRGRADIRAGAEDRRRSGVQGPGTHTLHVITTTAVTLAGDRASARSYIMLLTNTHTKAELGFCGIYNDEFVRTPDGWRLASRVISPR